MSPKSGLFILLVTIGAASLTPRRAEACSCFTAAPCQAVWQADTVFVGRVRGFDDETVTVGARTATAHVRATLDVLERYRGDIGANATIDLRAALCSYTGFVKGGTYIVYARRTDRGWTTSMCSRTTRLAEGQEDLAYLRSLMPPPASGAPVRGRVIYVDRNTGLPYGGPRGSLPGSARPGIVLRNSERETTLRVGLDGRIEGSVAPGAYDVEVRPAPGLFARFDPRLFVPHARSCPSLHVTLGDDGHVKGRVVDAGGRPVAGARVEIGEPSTGSARALAATLTDAAGYYDLAQVPPGYFRIEINLAWRLVHGNPPTPRVFLPGTTDSRQAGEIMVRAREHVDAPEVRLPPQLALAAIAGTVHDADGRPASGVRVFIQEAASWVRPDLFANLDHVRFVSADERGRFSVTGLRDAQYRIMAERSTTLRNASFAVTRIVVDRSRVTDVRAGQAGPPLLLYLARVSAP